MSKKRKSAESNNALFETEVKAKCAKVDSLMSDTTLQDLPIELLESILVEVVAMEVKGWWLAKSDWEARADLVISRLKTVCSQWSSILTTNFFRNELKRALNRTAEATIRLEILLECPISSEIRSVATLRDEIFMLDCPKNSNSMDYVIYVYDRNNMTAAKHAIPIPGKDLKFMAACHVSNCLYVCMRVKRSRSRAIYRITKAAEQQYDIAPWVNEHNIILPISQVSVSANGSLIIVSEPDDLDDPDVVSTYNPDGSLQQEVKLSRAVQAQINVFRYKNMIQKLNGHLVLGYVNDQDYQTSLVEFDTSGSIVRQYHSSVSEESSVLLADIYGRIMVDEPFRGMEILDSEFNVLGTYTLQKDAGMNQCLFDLHHESERNEIVRISCDRIAQITSLTIFRFTAE